MLHTHTQHPTPFRYHAFQKVKRPELHEFMHGGKKWFSIVPEGDDALGKDGANGAHVDPYEKILGAKHKSIGHQVTRVASKMRLSQQGVKNARANT
jgi:hypothetical protein